ncbi:hypothetical protein JXL21_12120, partial [Candidatus Bathyarchaeota archaeon]|nr:hypothetical protein [Candidatus Bathyarchaeota archaeon]
SNGEKMVTSSGITGTGLHLAAAGARGVHVKDVGETLEAVRAVAGDETFQLFDAGIVAGWRHLFHAAVNAYNALSTGEAVSKSLDVETLLYASCQDQISKAFDLMGLNPDVHEVAALVFSEDKSVAEGTASLIVESLGVVDDSVLAVTPNKFSKLKKVFEVGDEALEAVGGNPYDALTSLVIEKGALLPLRR